MKYYSAHPLSKLLAFLLLTVSAALAAAPVNDNYGSAAYLGNTLPVNITGTNVDATEEAGEVGSNGSASVWYRWTSLSGGFVDIRTEGADFDTTLAVFSFSAGLPGAGDLIAYNDDGGPNSTSRLVLPLRAGQAIAIRVAGYLGGTGSFPLAITSVPTPYDQYANRLALPNTARAQVDVNNEGASLQTGEHVYSVDMQGTLWFTWAAPSTGSFRVDTLEGSATDTMLTVYTQTPAVPGAAQVIGSNDDAISSQRGSEVVFSATTGTTYAFQVGGFRVERGPFTLTVAPNVPRPINDYYAGRSSVSNVGTVTVTGNNTAATLERNESIPVTDTRATLWYSWTAPATGPYQFDTLTGPSMDTVLAVYATTPATPLLASRLGFNDDFLPGSRSRVIVNVTAGQVYTVQVGSAGDQRGSFSLRVGPAAPADIAVEVTGGAGVSNGQIVTRDGALMFATGFPFTVRNAGDIALTGVTVSLSGAHAADFSFASQPAAFVDGGASSSFQVTCVPSGPGTRTAILRIVSNDADESPYDITLRCVTFSDTLDSDDDGLSDGAEVRLARLGFDPADTQFDLVEALFGGANGAGLYTREQLQSLHAGARFAARDPQTGRFTLKLHLDKSTDLTNYSSFPFIPAGTTVDAAGDIRFEFDAPGGAAFLKLEIE